MTNHITSKKQSYDLYLQSRFGNHLGIWASVEVFQNQYQSGQWEPNRAVALRLRSTPGTNPPHYCLPIAPSETVTLEREWVTHHQVPQNAITVSEVAEDSYLTIQGEVMRSTDYVSLRWSNAQTMMRNAWKLHEAHKDGIDAYEFLRHHMDYLSFENLNRLFDEFPDSVIEFSCYSKPVGIFSWNTVFWEVRNY